MHVRFSTQHRNGKTYRYVQLVQSFRRPDGMPAHRVVANLGQLSDLEVENLKAALAASREGHAVVLPKEARTKGQKRSSIRSNLVYLPLAVLRRIWSDDGLCSLVAECLAAHGGDAEVAQVVEALVLQRCVAPGSKLASVEWFGRTALPELMGMAPGRYNNSRVHRVLEILDGAEGEIQKRLPGRVRSRCGEFISLFGDVTDTWFEGEGPELAKPGRDKEGLYRRRIGIAMLCDQRGVPLRWKTLPGDYKDDRALTELAAGLSKESWAAEVPVVMDRSMGRAASVAFLAGSGLRFLTAIPVDEFATCGAQIPWEAFAALEPKGTEASLESDLALASEAARVAGMTRARPDRWVLDLGVFGKQNHTSTAHSTEASRAVVAMRLALSIMDSPRSLSKIAKEDGASLRYLQRTRCLCDLIEPIQIRILAGEADGLPVDHLYKLSTLPEEAQIAAFDEALTCQRKTLVPRRGRSEDARLLLRGVVHFNPERFVEERRAEAARHRELHALVEQIDARLGRAGSQATDRVALREVDDFLRRNAISDVFSACVVTSEDGVRRLHLQKNEAAWERRRRFHGFNLFVANADLPQSATELVELYFAKDAIEKDFQVIKSALSLRPVRHRTDSKVRAHVTLCVLALLLARLLERRMKEVGRRRSASSALELLDPCHLNLADDDGSTFYTVTQPTPDQRDLLTALGMKELTDDPAVALLITPR